MSQPQVLTIKECSARLGLSEKTCRRIFKAELGTILLKRPGSGRKQVYCSVRVPEAVFLRVLKKMSI